MSMKLDGPDVNTFVQALMDTGVYEAGRILDLSGIPIAVMGPDGKTEQTFYLDAIFDKRHIDIEKFVITPESLQTGQRQVSKDDVDRKIDWCLEHNACISDKECLDRIANDVLPRLESDKLQ